MFNNNYTLIKKNKFLRLTNIKHHRDRIRFKQKHTMIASVTNTKIDWHCTKPLGKNELGLWFSFITQPFSTRKHWWILLPAQNLVFRLHWERSQSSDSVASKVTNVTSLNWFSEKPVYFYVVIPFLGCLGLISGSLPNDLIKTIPSVAKEESARLSFPIHALSPFGNAPSYLSSMAKNDPDTFSQKAFVSFNCSYDRYIATYADSHSYLKHLNSVNLLKNLNRGLDYPDQSFLSPQTSSVVKVFDVFKNGKEERTSFLSFSHPKNFDYNANSSVKFNETKHSGLWEKYLLEKSKINWFWSKWAVQDFSLLKEKNSRVIWEKINASSFYKIICDKTSSSDRVFDQSVLLNKSSNISDPFVFQKTSNQEGFAQKLFSLYFQFPKRLLTNTTQHETKFSPTIDKNRKYSSFRTIGFKKEVGFDTNPFFVKKLDTLNFILIDGLRKTVQTQGVSPCFPGIAQENYHRKAETESLLFDMVGLNRSDLEGRLTEGIGYPNRDDLDPKSLQRKDVVLPFSHFLFVDKFFVELYTNKTLKFLKPYFFPKSGTTLQNVSSTQKNSLPLTLNRTPLKKLNFPILLSGYLNSNGMKLSSQLKESEETKPIKKTRAQQTLTKSEKSALSPYSLGFRNRDDLTHIKMFRFHMPFGSSLQNLSSSHNKVALLNNFICNTKNKSSVSSSNFKWRSIGNYSFYWNYFKHFYGASSFLKPWSSTFDSVVTKKPSKTRISTILFQNLFSPFKSLMRFPEANFLFNKWHSKKKQGFFYKRITKLEVKNRKSQTSGSKSFQFGGKEGRSPSFQSRRVVSLLWGFRAKYKLDEVLQYQKSKYYQSKKAQQTAHQNVNQNSTNTNINNQIVMKTLTKRRRYKKYIEFNLLSSWLRDVFYFKKMGRKCVKLKKDTYLFNYSNMHKKLSSVNVSQTSKNLLSIGFSVKHSLTEPTKNYVFPFYKYAKKVTNLGGSFNPRWTQKSEKKKVLRLDSKSERFRENFPSVYVKKGSTRNFDFNTDFFVDGSPGLGRQQSLNSSKTLFRTLNNFSSLNKFYPLDSSFNAFKGNRVIFPTTLMGPTMETYRDMFGGETLAWNPFLVNKTPVFLKKRSLNSSNKRFFGSVRNSLTDKSALQNSSVGSKMVKNLNSFWTQLFPICLKNFQKNIGKIPKLNKLGAKFTVSNKQIKPKALVVQKNLFSQKSPNQNVFKLTNISMLKDSKKSLQTYGKKKNNHFKSFLYLSKKLKTNSKTALVNKVSNLSKKSLDSSRFSLFSQNGLEAKPFINVQNQLPSNAPVEFKLVSLDELSFRFKNLASSFVIWRNKFQIRRDYLLLSYIYLDYLGTIINSFKISSNFLPFAQAKEPTIGTLSSGFELKSNYFLQSETYKTNLMKPFWSFSIINHLKTNHVSIYEQLLNSSDASMASGFSVRLSSNRAKNNEKKKGLRLDSKSERFRENFERTTIPNFGVLPKNSMSSLSHFSNRTSSVFFNRSMKGSNPFFTRFFLTSEPRLNKNGLFSFSDSTALNKNYLDYKTKFLNQKIILLKRQKLMSSFSKGLKKVKLRVKEMDNVSLSKFNQTLQWSKFKYRRKPGIYKSRLFHKETKIYSGILFQNLGIHLNVSSGQNLTFWLCTVIFQLCLLSSLMKTYKVSVHFCLKTLYSSLFILNKYFVYVKYRVQRLISYIYQNNFETFFENVHIAVCTLKTQTFLSLQKLNFSLKNLKYSNWFLKVNLEREKRSFSLFHHPNRSNLEEQLNFIQPPSVLGSFNSSQPKSDLTNFSQIALNNNSFNKLFFLPYSYVSSRKKGNQHRFNLTKDYTYNKFKVLTLFQYVQAKYDTPFSNFQFYFKQFDKQLDEKKTIGQSKLDLKTFQFGKGGLSSSLLSANFSAQSVSINNDKLKLGWNPTDKGYLNKNQQIRSTHQTSNLPKSGNIFGLFLKNQASRFISSEPERNIKLYFKVLKWNMLLTLLIGESEVLAELEPYREMHWYFLKKFPIFLRTSATKDYLNMADYQADEKIRIIKQKIRQTIMILYLRTRKYESKVQNRITQSEKKTNSFVRNRLNQKNVRSHLKDNDSLKPDLEKASKYSFLAQMFTFWQQSGFSFQLRRRKIKKLSFWKSLLTFLGKYSFLSRSATLSKRFRESLMMFSYPLVSFGPIGTIFFTYALKKFILDFEGNVFRNYYQKPENNTDFFNPINHQKKGSNLAKDSETLVFSSLLRGTNESSPFVSSSNTINALPDTYTKYIFQKIHASAMFESQPSIQVRQTDNQLEFKQFRKSLFDFEFFTDLQKFVKKYNRVYVSLSNTLNTNDETKNYKKEGRSPSFQGLNRPFLGATQSIRQPVTPQTLKFNDFYDWSYSEKYNQLGKNSIYSDTFDPKLRYYRFSTNFSKVLSDVGGFYTNIAAQQELGPLICKVYTGWFTQLIPKDAESKDYGLSFSHFFDLKKQSAKNYLLVSGSSNPEAVVLLIQALSAEMGMKLFMEDAKRLQRIGRRGINKATKRLEKLFDIAQANTPALVFIEDIHVIGAKTKMIKVDEEQDDVEILSRSLLSKLVYRKSHKNKSLRESFMDQNLFTGGPASMRRRSLKPTNPIPTSLVLYQLTRRRALSNFFKSQENPARRLNNKLFLSKKLSPAFTTNAVLIWKLFKSKIATPNKRIKEAPWYHIPVDAMRSINPLTYSIRVKVAKITLLAIFTMGTRLRLVKDLIRLFEKIQFESYQNFIVFATTNKLSTLDPNLRRPGRLEETISLEALTGSASSSRSPAFMTILDTFKVHLKNVPGFSKTFNVIDHTLFSNNLNLQEWTVINYFAENAYYSFENFKHHSITTNLTPMDFFGEKKALCLPFLNASHDSINNRPRFVIEEQSKIPPYQKYRLFSTNFINSSQNSNILTTRSFINGKVSHFRSTTLKVKLGTKNDKKFYRKLAANRPFSLTLRLGSQQNDFNSRQSSSVPSFQRMTSFATKNKINSPFSFFSNQTSGSNSTSSYWQSLFSNILVQRKIGLFTFAQNPYGQQATIHQFYKSDKFNLFLIFAYSRSGQNLISFLSQNRNQFGLRTNSSVMFDSDYLMNLQLWPEIVNLLSYKKSNILSKRRQNLHASFLKFFASKVGEVIFLNSVIWTTPSIRERSNLNNVFGQNRFIMYSNSGLHNIYNTTSSWMGAYGSIKNVGTTSALYSKTPLLSKLLRLEDVSKPRQKQFFESLNAGMLFEYSDFHYRSFLKKNNLSTEENLNLLIHQKYMLNNQGRPLRKYVKLEHSNRLWLFRILYTELGSLDNITLNPTSMNYYYRNKIALKQVFKLSSYQWWNWHLRKPLEQLEDIQEIAYFPCENKYYTPRRRRWMLTNGFWGYWFSFDKNFYFDLYEQYMLQTLHFACLQLDKNREVLDYLAKFYIYKEKLSETDIIFALKRYQI